MVRCSRYRLRELLWCIELLGPVVYRGIVLVWSSVYIHVLGHGPVLQRYACLEMSSELNWSSIQHS